MAVDALGIPYDITWQRLAWSSDMVDRSFGRGQPPLWRSSMAVSIYPIPLADTVDDYPDHRIFYLKVSASITGWSEREALAHFRWPPHGDAWQQEGWESIRDPQQRRRPNYWPCVGATLQVAIYPRPEQGVDEADYPFVVDFEPKKRELYEAVTDAKELLSASRTSTSTRKGTTTTSSGEIGFAIPIPGVGDFSTHYGQGTTVEDITTTERSTERRETEGRTTQLSQMYQLFNGYHLGTNRALFAIFPRPHIVNGGADDGMIETALMTGQRKLEGIQDVMLIVQVPRSVPGICVRGYLDTAHEGFNGVEPDWVAVRRWVSGCGEWNGDRLRAVAAPSPVPHPLLVVGEHQAVGGWQPGYRDHLWTGRRGRVEIANLLNKRAADVRERMMANAMSGAYEPVPFEQSATFRLLVGRELQGSGTRLTGLVPLGHVATNDLRELSAHGIATVGELFATDPKSPAVAAVRQRLLDALIEPLARPPGEDSQQVTPGAGATSWPAR